jgi:hypothetical protein
MDKEFVPYQPSLDLKELGFDEPCFAYFYHHQEYKILFDNPTQSRDYNSIKVDVGSIFDNNEERVKKGLESLGDSVSRITSIPTFSQAFRWFREKCKLHSNIYLDYGTFYFIIQKYTEKSKVIFDTEAGDDFGTYEEAELECLVKLIEIVKKQNLKG